MTIEEQIALIDQNVDMVDYISQYTDFRQKGRELNDIISDTPM